MLYRSLSQLERQFGRDGKRAWYDSAAWRAYGPRYGQGTLRSLRLLWRPADQPEPITGITAPARPAARPRQPPEGVKTSRNTSGPSTPSNTRTEERHGGKGGCRNSRIRWEPVQ